MLVAVDIGNTNICFAVFNTKKEEMLLSFRLKSDTSKTTDEYFIGINTFFTISNISKNSIQSVYISSVVPALDVVISSVFKKFFDKDCVFLNYLNIPLKINLYNEKEVGSDRLVDCYGGLALTKFAKNVIVIDFGTATTFNLSMQSKIYEGGVIFPGIVLSLNSLKSGTAKISNISLQNQKTVTGKSTIEAIGSGIFFGYKWLVKGIINEMMSENKLTPKNTSVIATGGLSSVICTQIEEIDIIDENLTMKGIFEIFKFLNAN